MKQSCARSSCRWSPSIPSFGSIRTCIKSTVWVISATRSDERIWAPFTFSMALSMGVSSSSPPCCCSCKLFFFFFLEDLLSPLCPDAADPEAVDAAPVPPLAGAA